MNATCLRLAAILCLFLLSTFPALAQRERGPNTDVRGILKSVDPNANTITVAMGEGRDVAANEKTFTLAKGVEVAVGGGGMERRAFGVLQQGKLTDLTAGIPVSLALSADGKSVECIIAEGPMIRGTLKFADAQKRTITVGMSFSRGREGEPGAEEKTITVAKDAEIGIDDGRGRRFSIKEGRFEDLASGCTVTVRLAIDQKSAVGVFAEGPMFNGTVKSVDAAKNVLVVKLGGERGDAGEERTITVPAGATIIVDDGKGKRFSLREGKLTDVTPGAMIVLKMSVDQTTVGFIRVQGAMVPGQLKSVDAKKGTITILRPVARGEAPEEKTYDVAKDAKVTIEGKDVTLADLKVDDEQFLMLQLSLDSKTVQSITVGNRRRDRE